LSKPSRNTIGRAAILLVLGALVLTVCAGVYIIMSRALRPLPVGLSDNPELLQQAEARRLVALLAILLIAALLILLFVLGAYLLIRAGRVVARERVGGRPTEYVDVWGSYRITDEQIRDATGRRRRGPDDANDVDDADDELPPPADPTAEN
jgi:hypothetical protein